MRPIDLRSDTVTHPTPAMREAMYRADVGDDVYGEDPTVNRLEQMSADRLGKEAGVFVASGTMGNLVALLTHAGRGDEVIVGDKAHTLGNEVAGAAWLAVRNASALGIYALMGTLLLAWLWTAQGYVAGIPLDALTWLTFGLAATRRRVQ